MSFGFGAATKPAAAGAPAGFGGGGGGFGATKPATAPTTGFGAPAATGGFGAPASAGGFGAPAATGGFGAPAAAGGFGASANKGFGAPASTGFGAPAAGGGFGAPANTGFGAPASTGFGAPSGGFGAPANTGFGASNTGFGAPQQQPLQPSQGQPYQFLPNFVRQSALANYMHELDAAYNALHPKCRFRTFVYNMCGTGQGTDAIQRDRYITFMNGGGIDDAEYMIAMHNNPDPEHLYPAPVHFNQELALRVDRQKEVIQELTTRLEEVMQDVHAVMKLDRSNKQQMRELRLEESMLQRRWYAVLQRAETLRLFGVPIDMESLLAHRAETVRQQIAAPGSYTSTLAQLQPRLEEESSQRAAGAQTIGTGPSSARQNGPLSGQRGALVGQLSVEPEMMQGWLQMATNMQNGIDTLEELLKSNLGDMQRIRERVRAASLN